MRRREPADRLTREGETLLLYERQVVRLGPIGSAIFETAAAPVELAELAEALEAAFGAPPDGSLLAATTAAVADLLRQQVLEEVRTDTGPADLSRDSADLS